MRLACPTLGVSFEFERVPLKFSAERYRDVFSAKNNKSLGETISHRKYLKLAALVRERYPNQLSTPLGQFLSEIKGAGDNFYQKFLNKYGDGEYSRFEIGEPRFLAAKGIYAYTLEGALLYLGRCRDRMSKRINQGYGKVHPKNCFLDGQATNCHLNALITSAGSGINLWLCAMKSDEEIVVGERALIRDHAPPWNIQIAL